MIGSRPSNRLRGREAAASFGQCASLLRGWQTLTALPANHQFRRSRKASSLERRRWSALPGFAIECFLKLLLLETGRYPDWEHALDKLFNSLSPVVQGRIEGNFSNASGVRYYLEQARNAFIEWRYPHEYEFLLASDEELAGDRGRAACDS